MKGSILVKSRLLLTLVGYLFVLDGPEVARKWPERSPEMSAAISSMAFDTLNCQTLLCR